MEQVPYFSGRSQLPISHRAGFYQSKAPSSCGGSRLTTTMSDQIAEDRKKKDQAVRATIMQKLIETGEKENLKEMLRNKLIECGWRDDLREHCKEVIRSKGLERITVDELVQMITPRGRDTVPDQIKADLLQRIRQFLQST